MTEQSMSIDRMENVINVFGSFDENLRLIEGELGVRVTDRESELRITGETENVMLAQRAIEGLMRLASKGENIDEQSVRYILGKMRAAKDDKFSFRAFSLDATVFQCNGAWYYVWAEKVGVGKQVSNLYIARMKNGYTLDTVQVMLTTPDYDWERYGFWVNEGPAVIKRNGKVYMTYSASDTGVNYCMGMLTADEDADLLDPLSWKKERWPVLRTDLEKGVYGPGHNSFTKDENGNDILVFHARTEPEIEGNPLYNPNRHAMLQPIDWNDEKPIFSFDNEL